MRVLIPLLMLVACSPGPSVTLVEGGRWYAPEGGACSTFPICDGLREPTVDVCCDADDRCWLLLPPEGQNVRDCSEPGCLADPVVAEVVDEWCGSRLD